MQEITKLSPITIIDRHKWLSFCSKNIFPTKHFAKCNYDIKTFLWRHDSWPVCFEYILNKWSSDERNDTYIKNETMGICKINEA